MKIITLEMHRASRATHTMIRIGHDLILDVLHFKLKLNQVQFKLLLSPGCGDWWTMVKVVKLNLMHYARSTLVSYGNSNFFCLINPIEKKRD